MKRRTVPIRFLLLILLLTAAGLAAPSSALPQASTVPQLSGFYKIVQKAEKDAQAKPEVQVELQFHLVNRTSRELHIQRITLWDFAHPSKGGTRACSIVVNPAASASTTQQFTIPRAELDLWKRGTRPRVVLELATPHGHPSTAVIRLDRAAGEKEY